MNLILLFLLSVIPGQIYKISNLKDIGPGSLRECVEAAGSRTCVFEISGAIELKSNLIAKHPNLHIFGQTAPGLIELRGAGLHISADDVSVQHIAIRPGDARTGPDPTSRDALQITNYTSKEPITNVTVDHCSLTWAVDENASIYGDTVSNVRITNNIIAEGLYKSIHPKGPHGFGFLVNPGARTILLQGNLFAHNYDRNPRIQDGVTIQILNNAFYNQGGTSCWNGANFNSSAEAVGSLVNFVGNVYFAGESTPVKICPSIYGDKTVPVNTRIYVEDNFGPARTSPELDEWKISGLPIAMRATAPLLTLPEDVLPANKISEWLVANAGARPWDRSQVDARIVAEFVAGTGDIKDCVAGCPRSAGGWETLPSIKRPLTPPPYEDGFNLWLETYAKAPAVVLPPPIKLKKGQCACAE